MDEPKPKPAATWDGVPMNRHERRAHNVAAVRRVEDWLRVPPSEWPHNQPDGIVEVWMSTSLLVQVYAERDGAERLSVCRVTVGSNGRWQDGITWDELQSAKGGIGRAHRWAVEIYPPDADVVNVANMRHLWLVPEESVPFAWRNASK